MVVRALIAFGIVLFLIISVASIFVFTSSDVDTQSHPRVQASFDYTVNESLVVTHNGGNAITGQNARALRLAGDVDGFSQTSRPVTTGDSYNAGDVLFNERKPNLSQGDTIQVLLVGQESGQEIQIGKYTV
jgi:hypothetical protein